MAALVSFTNQAPGPDLPKSVNKFGTTLREDIYSVECPLLELDFLEADVDARLRTRLIQQANKTAQTDVTCSPAWLAATQPDHPFIIALLELMPIVHAVRRAGEHQSVSLGRLSGLPDEYVSVIVGQAAKALKIDRSSLPQASEVRSMIEDPATFWMQHILRADDFTAASRLLLRADDLMNALERAFQAVCPPVSEVTDTGIRLVRGREDDIRDEAESRAERGQFLLNLYRSAGVDITPADREAADARYWRRKIRRQVLDAQAHFDTALRLARESSPFASRFTLSAYRERQMRAKAWAKATFVKLPNGDELEMEVIQEASRKARLAQVYATTKAMEALGETYHFVPLFLTLTLPGCFHPRTTFGVTNGSSASNDNWIHGPKSQMEALNGAWRRFRARLAKTSEMRQFYGLKVIEPHKDGTPHMHALLWVPRTYSDDNLSSVDLVTRHLQAVLPGEHATKIEEISAEAATAKAKKTGKQVQSAAPSSYVLKYILKSLNVSAAEAAEIGMQVAEDVADEEHIFGDGADRYKAWACARRIRRFDFIGVSGSLRILQRIRTADESEIDDWPERAQEAWQALQTASELGDVALACKKAGLAGEAKQARRRQSNFFINALSAIGALKLLAEDQDGVLRLHYEDAVTEHGRTIKKATGIIDTETGEVFSLKANEGSEIITDFKKAAEKQKSDEDHRRRRKPDEVTLVAIYPRAGSSPGLCPLSDEDAFIEGILRGPPDILKSQNDNAEHQKVHAGSR